MTAKGLDRGGRAPLHCAAPEDRADEVAELIAAGADVNAADKQGFTPLHFACQQGSLASAKLLLAAEANANARNGRGNGTLWVATFNSRGSGDLVRLLREAGADPLAANDAGKTPVNLVRIIANYDVAQYFADLSD